MNENNLILSSLRNTEERVNELNKSNVPAGYVEIRLSTQGRVGAPKSFHIRNFKIKDILALSLTETADLPSRLIKILNDMIWEDVDVAYWHEKEIEETMLYVYMTFFGGTFKSIPFEVIQEDIDWLEANGRHSIVSDIESGKWLPKTDINIASAVETYDLDENFKTKIKITNKKTGFYVVFDYIKYGDQLVIKQWLNEYFKEEEKKFDIYKRNVEFNRNLMSKAEDDPSVLNKLLYINPEEKQAYDDFIAEKINVLTDVVKLISVVDYNGEDVSEMSLSDKYELLSNDARIDVGLINKLTKKQNSLNFGIKPEVKMENPLTKGVVSRPFTFRISTLISAIQASGLDDNDDCYDDED